MRSPPFPRYLVPPRSKYSPQHHVLKIVLVYSDKGLISNYYKYPLCMCVTLWLAISLLTQVFITAVCNNLTNESKKLSDKYRSCCCIRDWQPMTFTNCKYFRFRMELSGAELFSVNSTYLYSSTAVVITYTIMSVHIKQLNKNVRSKILIHTGVTSWWNGADKNCHKLLNPYRR